MELPADWRKALTAVHTRLKELAGSVPAKGLDATMAELVDLLAAVWTLEARGTLLEHVENMPAVNRFAQAFESQLKKLAPPPPRKIKRDAPPRKILPLSESSVGGALDAIQMVHALVEVGDFTRQSDKARASHFSFMDDWRRMVWESARISSWDRFRQLCSGDHALASRLPERRFSRAAALTLLEALARHRTDLITPIPSISMLACQKCGRFEGRERVRCTQCARLFCGRCFSRSGGLCLGCYSTRYQDIPVEIRIALRSAARTLCSLYRLDEFTRNEAYVRALDKEGVRVVFHDEAPEEGEEVVDRKGNRSIRLRDRENATAKKILFAALARCHFREVELEPDPGYLAYFVDCCLGLPVEEALDARPSGA